MGIVITYRGYNNGYNNPVYNAHKTVDVLYTWECVMQGKIQYVNFINLWFKKTNLGLIEGALYLRMEYLWIFSSALYIDCHCRSCYCINSIWLTCVSASLPTKEYFFFFQCMSCSWTFLFCSLLLFLIPFSYITKTKNNVYFSHLQRTLKILNVIPEVLQQKWFW